jgi:hypothetical protein
MIVFFDHQEASMKSTIGTSQHTHGNAEAEDDERIPDKTPEPKAEDDGSVPDKQISRWKGEGGSLRPAD